jgi:hypothetical protein
MKDNIKAAIEHLNGNRESVEPDDALHHLDLAIVEIDRELSVIKRELEFIAAEANRHSYTKIGNAARNALGQIELCHSNKY